MNERVIAVEGAMSQTTDREFDRSNYGETVASYWKMRCPNPECKRDDALDVYATVCVRLTPDGSDADESGDGDHDWDGETGCVCRACNWSGKVSDTEIDLLIEIESLLAKLPEEERVKQIELVSDGATNLLNDLDEDEIATLYNMMT
jgi:hypothetical protein